MGDEAEQLAEAAKLPWEDRFVHKFWKARVAAYEAVVKEASINETVNDSACLKAFGTSETKRISPRNHL
jgi:cytoskeleton-associated protein 5